MKPFLDFEDTNNLKNSYKTFKYKLDEFNDMNTVDTAGYFGNHYRLKELHNKKFEKLESFDVILEHFAKDNKLIKVMQTIRTIDKDKNGFVTDQELEDILKLHYPDKLDKYNIKPVLQQFACESNRLLLNYNKFKDCVKKYI